MLPYLVPLLVAKLLPIVIKWIFAQLPSKEVMDLKRWHLTIDFVTIIELPYLVMGIMVAMLTVIVIVVIAITIGSQLTAITTVTTIIAIV